MIEVVRCVAVEHDLWLVLVAVLISGVGAFVVAQMFEQARSTTGVQRLGWTFLTAIAAGATIWCTHFVAMLAYEVDVPVHLDPVLTIVSLIVAIVGMSIGLSVALKAGSPLYPVIGGALAGGAISCMHFAGMAAYRVDGLVEWRTGYVVASVACAVLFSAAGFAALCSSRLAGRRRLLAGAALFATAILTLHFVAMTALSIAPLAAYPPPIPSEGMHALGLATALVGLIVIAAGVAAARIDRQTRSDAMQRLHHMAMNDALTGLPNRSGFQTELARQIELARKTGGKLAVVAIDLDRFKEINDVHGHKAGDDVLTILAKRMRSQLQGDEVVARLGGDEFVALARFGDRDELARFVGRLDMALKAPLDLGVANARIVAGIGVAVFPDNASDAETLTNNADLAMYRAKRDGSFEPRYYDAKLDEAVRERRELASDLRQALVNHQLEIHYQVQASLQTREVTGYEALLRWRHPVHGMIPPTVFIAVAEESGLMLALGEWVLRRACAEAVTWPNPAKVSVNVSPLQLAHADLPGLFRQVLRETGLPARRLEIELTETAFVGDRTRAFRILRQLKAQGIGVALDDFGTGYSSLETLRVFPFDKIKLDRFFISGLADSPQAIAIVRAVLALGKSLSIPVLAEGIETDAQLEVLRREGCDEAQGFLLGRPAPPAAITGLRAVGRELPRDRPLGGIAPQAG